MPRGMRFECLIYVTSLSGADKNSAVAVETSGDIFAIHLALPKDIFAASSPLHNISEPVVILFGARKMQSLAACIVTFCNESLNHRVSLYKHPEEIFISSIHHCWQIYAHTHERRKTLRRANLSAPQSTKQPADASIS